MKLFALPSVVVYWTTNQVDKYKKPTPIGANLKHLFSLDLKVSSFQLREQERKAQVVNYVILFLFCAVCFLGYEICFQK